MKCTFTEILLLPLFAGIPEEELSRLWTGLRYTELEFQRGQTLLMQQDPYDELYLLIRGQCFAEILDINGKKLKIEDFHPPAILASGVLFASRNCIPGTVTARTAGLIVKVPREEILSLCLESRRFLGNFLNLISNKFLFISRRLSFLSFKSIREKLGNYLLSQPAGADGSRQLGASLEELACYFGVSRPSLSRVLGQLEAEGTLSRRGKKIFILRQKELQK